MKAPYPENRVHLGEFDFNLLRALDALLTFRNVTRAGESIGLGQSAMSDSLRRLRLAFKDELLVRVGREYRLTPLATELREPVKDILVRIEQALNQRVEFDPRRDERSFTLAASDYSAFFLLQKVAQRVINAAPAVSLNIEHVGRGSRSELEDGRLDILIGPCDANFLAHQETLFRDRWVCIVWAGNTEVGERLSVEEYRQLPHLTHGVGDNELTRITERVLDDLPVERKVRVNAEAFFMAATLLVGTTMVALVPERLAKHLAVSYDIRLLEPPFAIPSIEIAMFWSGRSDADPAHQWLRSEIKAVADTL